MMKTAAYKSGLTVVCLSILLAACASPKTQQEAKTSVDEAQTTLANFVKDPDMEWLQQHMKDAKAVLISPKIVQAGFIVGGSGGPAVVLARSSSSPQGWTSPAFYKIGTATLGLQAGAESMQMVALIMTDKALNSLLSSSFKLGGDVSVAAGPVGTGANAPVGADIVAFTKAKGLYGGVNLNGTSISIDDDGNKTFYGQPASPVDILVKHTVSSPYGAALARTAASASRASGAAGSSGER
jgi:lipid-binding SYLF domain-containing protein